MSVVAPPDHPSSGGGWARALAAFARRAPLLPVLIFLALLMVWPVAQLLGLSFFNDQGQLTWGHYSQLFSSRIYVEVLWITVRLAFFTTVVAVIVAYPVAFVIANSENKVRAWLYFLVLIPFWTSFLVRALAWMVLLGRNGTINSWAQALGLTDAPMSLIYNFAGVLIGTTHALLPMAIIIIVSVMENIDQNLSKAAMTMGGGRGTAFWRVFFPLSLPGVTSAALLVFLSALGFFITPTLLGGRREVVISQLIITEIQEMLNWPFGGAVSVLLLGCALVIFWLYDRLAGFSALGAAAQARVAAEPSRLSRVFARLSIALLGVLGRITDRLLALAGADSRPLEDSRTGGRSASLAWKVAAGSVLFFACAPIFIMIPVSFTQKAVMEWPPSGFTFEWYRMYLQSPQWISATVTSFTVAFAASLLTMALAVPAAFVLIRQTVVGRSAIMALLLSPMVVPRIIIAIALFYVYSGIGLVGTTVGLVLGHAVLSIPYALMGVMTVLRNYDERLDQAAQILGAGKTQTFVRITLPLIRFGVLSAFLLAFITSFDDLTVSLFITGGLSTTLPKQMWEDATLQVSPVLAAVSTLIIVFMLVVLALLEWLRRRGEASLKAQAGQSQ
ncbi:ABC transporter permease subunit [Ancylobacter sp. MQZ15Z-1]|uniref:ABC transporter permease subunit n=1 Tax=Ancylobacter mangrovi TaxID=2972472 RepID=A0A9X2T332_9HYPH|nr:ABC transporter permease subunit [Ancylobacter mangrovi]MCS0494526.1 ABC transporter permease subunit [Ancylobacter mangrovi]